MPDGGVWMVTRLAFVDDVWLSVQHTGGSRPVIQAFFPGISRQGRLA